MVSVRSAILNILCDFNKSVLVMRCPLSYRNCLMADAKSWGNVNLGVQHEALSESPQNVYVVACRLHAYLILENCMLDRLFLREKNCSFDRTFIIYWFFCLLPSFLSTYGVSATSSKSLVQELLYFESPIRSAHIIFSEVSCRDRSIDDFSFSNVLNSDHISFSL